MKTTIKAAVMVAIAAALVLFSSCATAKKETKSQVITVGGEQYVVLYQGRPLCVMPAIYKTIQSEQPTPTKQKKTIKKATKKAVKKTPKKATNRKRK